MIPVRIVFQGGGARLVTLLAAAEVLSEFERQGEIRVVRAAGTSAGAIVAAMYASPRPLAEQREVLRRVGSEEISKFSLPQKWMVFWDAFWGKPVLPSAPLDRLFSELLQVDGSPIDQASQLRIPVSIVCSDLKHRRSIVHDENSKTPLARILSDSCSFPFVFRSYKSDSLIVDGGICANLPSDIVQDSKVLVGDPQPDSRVIAFAFEKRTTPLPVPKSALQYAGALISTAIESSVEAAAERVALSGGAVCRLPDQFDTFEFAEALEEGLSGNLYNAARDRATLLVGEAIERFKAEQLPTIRDSRRLSTAQRMFAAHTSLMKSFPCRVERSATIVVANSLLPSSYQVVSDDIYQIVEYSAIRDQIFAVRIGIATGIGPVVDYEECIVRDGDGSPISCVQMLVSVPSEPDGGRSVSYSLIYFDEPLPKEKGPVRILYKSRQVGTMSGVIDKGWDWMRSRASQYHGSEIDDHILLAPASSPPIVASDLLLGLAELPESEWPANLGETRSRWCRSNVLDHADALKFATEYLGDATTIGKRAYGTRATSVEPSKYSGVLFRTISPPKRS